MTKTYHVTLPYPDHCLSPNARVNRYTVARARRQQKDDAYYAGLQALTPPVWSDLHLHPPNRVALKWLASPPDGRRRDDDNLIGSLKAARDGLAIALGVDDSVMACSGVEWREPVKGGQVVAEIKI